MRVDDIGFHPRNITIRKGESIVWTWKNEHDQAHNIINVNPPDSEVSLSLYITSLEVNLPLLVLRL